MLPIHLLNATAGWRIKTHRPCGAVFFIRQDPVHKLLKSSSAASYIKFNPLFSEGFLCWQDVRGAMMRTGGGKELVTVDPAGRLVYIGYWRGPVTKKRIAFGVVFFCATP